MNRDEESIDYEEHSSDKKYTKKVHNDHYDEEVDVDSNDELGESRQKSQPSEKNEQVHEVYVPKQNSHVPLPRFDIGDFENLTNNSDYKSLLGFMRRFQGAEIQLDTKLKPFIPSYIPSIGEVDSFIKVNKPDKSNEELGLNIIDEPTIEGVDPDTFILKLIYVIGQRGYVNNQISSIPNADKKPKDIQNWINKVSELPKMSTSVPYTKNMPDIEALMQLWPEKIENCLNEIKLPNENINLPTDLYARLVCNMLDIPIHKINTNKALIESLHVLFSLYSVVKENQVYKNIEKADNVQTMKFN